ncbi:MAG: radical SAM protein [Synergistaceae bacterium]|nr:radical SAM protein [Synergistaceae bacterium]
MFSGKEGAVIATRPRWWRREGEAAQCGLCFRGCRIPAGGNGFCGVRGWDGERFHSTFLGRFSSIAVDPVEKKPLRCWRPGTRIFSLGGVGCNMRCPFCQNHSIAQPANLGDVPLAVVTPEELARLVRGERLSSVAFTYNEPTLQAEYILEAAPLLREAGIAVVLVTNGMFSPEALTDLLPWVDAANVDVKTFDPEKYAALGGSLETVKENTARMAQGGVHVELTNLVTPGVSDSLEDFTCLVEWVANLSPEIPLHITRYFPAYRFTTPSTDLSLLRVFKDIARTRLSHSY